MTIAEKQLSDPLPALEERSSAVDIQVRTAWQEHLAVAVRAGAALLAVGGYGRRQLFPYSDVDLLLSNRAELLLSLEHLTMEMLRMPSEDHSRLSFDANDYRLLRIEELRMSASVAAENV